MDAPCMNSVEDDKVINSDKTAGLVKQTQILTLVLICSAAMGCSLEAPTGETDEIATALPDPASAVGETPAEELVATPESPTPPINETPAPVEPTDPEPPVDVTPERPEEPEPTDNPDLGDDMSDATLGDLVGVWVSDSGVLNVASEAGIISRWDQKQGWEAVGTPISTGLTDLHGQGEIAYAVGAGGAILRDGVAVASSSQEDLNGVWFTGANQSYRGVAVGDGGMVMVTHFEDEWFPMFAFGNNGDVTADLNAVWGFDSYEVFIAGDAGTLVRFNGKHWGTVQTETDEDLIAVSGSGEGEYQTVWVLGAEGTIGRYQYDEWWTYDNAIPTGLAMGGFAGSQPLVVGADGGAWGLSGKAVSWSPLKSGTESTLRTVHGTASGLWAAGQDGVVLKL
ncbi:MAG: hypothetical protein ACI9WU_003626 [Myxococcota bacterium]|jgi:hypothetical protein